MRLKTMAGLLAMLMLLAVAWRYRHAAWWQATPPALPAQPIVFDNGTVRERLPASAPGSRSLAERPIGAVRKCRRGQEVTYTNHACPPGTREAALGGHVNVVDGQRPPAAPAQVPADAAGPSLREQQVERAVRP